MVAFRFCSSQWRLGGDNLGGVAVVLDFPECCDLGASETQRLKPSHNCRGINRSVVGAISHKTDGVGFKGNVVRGGPVRASEISATVLVGHVLYAHQSQPIFYAPK